MPVILKTSTGRRLLKKLAEIEGAAVSRPDYTPRDQGLFQSGDYPFKISVTASTIRVTSGIQTRYGSPVTLAPDGGETYKTISAAVSGAFAASTQYFIYTILERSDDINDPALLPDSVNVYADTTFPFSDDITQEAGNIYKLIGWVSTNSDTIFQTPVQRWLGGDVDNISIVPDSDSQYDFVEGTDEYRYSSIEFAPRLKRHFRNLQLKNWHDPTAESVVSADVMPFQQDGDLNKVLRYTSINNMNTYFGENIEINYDQITNFNHPLLTFTPDNPGIAGKTKDHSHVYPQIGDTYLGANTGFGGGGVWFQNIGYGSDFGDLATGKAIDLMGSGLHSRAVGQDTTLNWHSQNLLNGIWYKDDSGAFVALEAVDSVSNVTGAIQARAGGIYCNNTLLAETLQLHVGGTPEVSNAWNKGNMRANVTGLVSLVAGTSSTLTAGTFLNLDPVELRINNTAAITFGGHTKGILTSQSGFEGSVRLLAEAVFHELRMGGF